MAEKLLVIIVDSGDDAVTRARYDPGSSPPARRLPRTRNGANCADFAAFLQRQPRDVSSAHTSPPYADLCGIPSSRRRHAAL